MDKFVIPLSDGYKLISERNTGEFDKELYVGIESPDGAYIQDLVVIRPTYRFSNNDVVFDSDKFEILVFSDSESEDYTHKFTVKRVNEDDQ